MRWWWLLSAVLLAAPVRADYVLLYSPTSENMLHQTGWHQVNYASDADVQNIQVTSRQQYGYFVTLRPPWTFPTLLIDPFYQCSISEQWFSGINVTFTISCLEPLPPSNGAPLLRFLTYGSLTGNEYWFGNCSATLNDPLTFYACGVVGRSVWIH